MYIIGKQSPQENLEVFNGEIGYVFPHQSDMWALSKPGHITRFNVTFSRIPDHVVPFSSEGRVTENIEFAYAISVHKAQGSEFEHVCFVIPKHKTALLSPELLYTGLTRASRRLTLFIEDDISPLLSFLSAGKIPDTQNQLISLRIFIRSVRISSNE